jgi:hypothetical protein
MARIALAATVDHVETQVDRGRGIARIVVMGESGSAADPDSLFDTLSARHRAVFFDRARVAEKREVERLASAFYLSAFPARAAYSGQAVLATPDGLSGGTRIWIARRAVKKAAGEALRGEPPWVSAARLGACYADVTDEASPSVAQRAFAELKAEGFRIDEVLKRLKL